MNSPPTSETSTDGLGGQRAEVTTRDISAQSNLIVSEQEAVRDLSALQGGLNQFSPIEEAVLQEQQLEFTPDTSFMSALYSYNDSFVLGFTG